MRKNIFTCIVILTFATLGVPKTFALKQAIFPDGKSLQPIPKGAAPNISGNINSTTGTLPRTETQALTQAGVNNETSQETPEETTNKRTFNFYLLWSSISLLGIAGLITVLRKIQQR